MPVTTAVQGLHISLYTKTHANVLYHLMLCMPHTQVEELSRCIARYKEALAPYPQRVFSGRGVVMIAGGLKYMVRGRVRREIDSGKLDIQGE